LGDFAVDRALGAGFSVIRRRPAVLLAWGLAYFLFGLLPPSLFWMRMWPAMVAQSAVRPGDPQAMMAAMSGLSAWAPVLWLLALILMSVMYGAVFRAVLQPQDRAFFYLRLSGRELWLGLTTLALLVVFGLGAVVLSVIVGVIAHTAPWYVTLIAVIACLVGMIWLILRLSLSMPMAFAEHRFVFAQSWRLTEGLALKLFGMALCLILIVIVAELVILAPVMLTFGLTGGLARLAEEPGRAAAAAAPWLIVAAVVFSFFGALVYAILGAPWASVYQQVTEGAEPLALD